MNMARASWLLLFLIGPAVCGIALVAWAFPEPPRCCCDAPMGDGWLVILCLGLFTTLLMWTELFRSRR
jgi:drug/metabolite transporter (DMT)-like permease